ncbi:MAG: cupin domain-containing protein [Noviherbaspirillum sp.]
MPLEIAMTTREFAPPAPSFDVSELNPAARCGFLRVPKGWTGELHPSPLRMWVFFLSGEMEFEASDGERRSCVAGTAMLLEDTTGKGHLSRVVGDADAVLAVVQL